GLVEDAVWNRFPHADSGDLGNNVVEALDVLNVEGREHVDAGGDQLLDIEIALWMAAAWGVGMRQFVDQHELWAALEDRVAIHLGEGLTFVVDLPPLHSLQALEKHLGLAPAMCFDDANNDVHPVAPPALRGEQHLVGFANPRGGTEENLEPAAVFLFRRSE